MNKLFTLAILTLLFGLQTTQAQTYKKKAVIFDAYYGGPNLFKMVMKTAYLGAASAGYAQNSKVSGIGPVGLRAEKMISRKVGFGVDVNMVTSGVYYEEENYTYNDLGDEIRKIDTYEMNYFKIGAIGTFNYHFTKSKKFDMFFTTGLGFQYSNLSFKTTEEGYELIKFNGMIPITGRVGMGMRYYFTKDFGFNFNIGAGHGGFFNGGLSYKL